MNLQNGEVVDVAQLADRTFLNGGFYGAAGLVAVQAAAAETASLRQGEELAEVVGHHLRLQVVEGKRLDARRVDDGAAEVEAVHLGKSRGVHAFSRKIRQVLRAQFQLRLYGVDQRRFAHARLPADQRDLVF